MIHKTTSKPITHFRVVDREVIIIGESTVWEGFQAETEFFQFHADRLGKFLDCEAHTGICYRSDGQSYAYAPDKASGETNGIYSPTNLTIQEMLSELH